MGNGAVDSINQNISVNQPVNGTATGVVYSPQTYCFFFPCVVAARPFHRTFITSQKRELILFDYKTVRA